MKKISALVLSIALCACGGTSNNQQISNAAKPTYQDWTFAAETLTEAMLQENAIEKQSVIILEDFTNYTQQQIDTTAITKQVRQKLLDSGLSQIAISFKNAGTTQTILLPYSVEANTMVKTPSGTIISVNSSSTEEETTYKVRANQGTDVNTSEQKNNNFITPDILLTGALIEKENNIKSGWFSPDEIQTEYYFELSLTDLATGEPILKGERQVVNDDIQE